MTKKHFDIPKVSSRKHRRKEALMVVPPRRFTASSSREKEKHAIKHRRHAVATIR